LEMNDPSTCMHQFVEREAHALDLLVDGGWKAREDEIGNLHQWIGSQIQIVGGRFEPLRCLAPFLRL
jgi:hypothetical protein